MKETFAWPVLKGAEKTNRYPAARVQYGDGYEQRAKASLKAKFESWSVECAGIKPTVDAIEAFLDRHGAVKAFVWVSPENRRLTVKADDVKKSHVGGSVWRLSAKFTEVES